MAKRKNTIRKVGKHIVSFDGDGGRHVAELRADYSAGEGEPSARGPPSERLLTVEETAEFLRCSASALNKWRVSGAGPRYIRINGLVRYRPSDLVAFVDNKSRMSTSEVPAA
jgi:hypothetical protein